MCSFARREDAAAHDESIKHISLNNFSCDLQRPFIRGELNGRDPTGTRRRGKQEIDHTPREYKSSVVYEGSFSRKPHSEVPHDSIS